MFLDVKHNIILYYLILICVSNEMRAILREKKKINKIKHKILQIIIIQNDAWNILCDFIFIMCVSFYVFAKKWSNAQLIDVFGAFIIMIKFFGLIKV